MSTIKVNTIRNSADVEQYLAKAWVNFNGTGTVAIRAAGNVSSITDNGTGDYTVNFTSAMADANYSTVSSYFHRSGMAAFVGITNDTAQTTTSRRIFTMFVANLSGGSSPVDIEQIHVAIFR